MSEYEYIEFNFTQKDQLESFKKLFDQIKEIHNQRKDYEANFFLNQVPDYVRAFFEKQHQAGGWTLPVLVKYLIDEMDVHYLGVSEKSINGGILEFEAGGYPYGGPGLLIILLKSFGLTPYEVYEGAATYKIQWTSDFEFIFLQDSRENNVKADAPVKSARPWWKLW